ncbi:SAM hydrolase/SAM-dependent halogenase family protein [Spirillospora sp. NBC_01491]|uniref:SAM hydrolase/SAM-dependent halogenase family protein n=1 Tax=Spirillospora sp. NBC_01491 TaxID=2976007 RepID=UPI002E3408D4|nr:SAM-dependent chlorinase/fluorinase [Spirillospora sp. NBC_01491]
MPDRPFVSLATDFGAAYTAVCAGVVYTIEAAANLLVLSDEITPYKVREGAMLLRDALPYLPVGVHIGIVDPGVGTSRAPIGIATGRGDVLVGPDNGLLVPAAHRLGGVVRAHRLDDPAYRLATVSTTFHGRDVFAPAAAHLARGADLAAFGAPIDPVPLDVPEPTTEGGGLTAAVLYSDRFGSLILYADRAHLTAALGPVGYGTDLTVTWDGGTVRVPFAETFGSVGPGEPLLWVDSSGRLGLAVNRGSAAERFGLTDESTVAVRR